MHYILIGDGCENCLYVSNTFSLLRLPLKKCNLQDTKENLTNAISLIVCNHIENQHKEQLHELIKSNNISFITFNKPSTSDEFVNSSAHFLSMPFSQYELKNVLGQCMKQNTSASDLSDFEQRIFNKLVGESKQIRQIKSLIKQVARTNTTVLILGQSGTGKDVIASCVHQLSDRKENPLVPLNCGAIPSELMESELFGHEKGAFTGALARRAGRFEMANGGTLFLDEIGDMPLPMQVKLLRVTQEQKFERVGGNISISVDTRLIAATNQNLEDLIQHHQFREDLYYRINVFPIYVPSLHERIEDIPLLVDHHLEKIYDRLKHHIVFTEGAKEMLCRYEWPGNIRELQNFLERMVILYPDHAVNEKDIESVFKKRKISLMHSAPRLVNKFPFNMKKYLLKIEQQIIEQALEQSNGIVSKAAEYLSLGHETLMEKIKKYESNNNTLKTAEEDV